MYKLAVFAIFVALASSSELDQVDGNWYPLAFYLPGEAVSSMYQMCISASYKTSNRLFTCGNLNFTGAVETELEDGQTHLLKLVPAIVVNTYEEARRTLILLKDCPHLHLLRFVGKYMIAYNVYNSERGTNMVLLSKEVPTRRELDAFIESVDELDKSNDEAVVCSREVMLESENRRAAPRDPKKNTSPLKMMAKFFGEH